MAMHLFHLFQGGLHRAKSPVNHPLHSHEERESARFLRDALSIMRAGANPHREEPCSLPCRDKESEDGSTAQGGLLIGADGASSTVRGQLLPQAKRIETGIVAISGKAPLNDYVRRITPTEFFAGPTLVLGPDGRFLFGSAVEFHQTIATRPWMGSPTLHHPTI